MGRPQVFRTGAAAVRQRNLNLAVYPNAHVGMAKSARVDGAGRLHLGPRWDGHRYMPGDFFMGEHARLTVNGNFRIYTGLRVSVDEGAHLTLGSGFVNDHSVIACFERITIGDDVLIAQGVTIRDSDNHELVGSGPVAAPITIGDHVWIGLNAVVLKGVTIGAGAVVAAGAVVVGDVPPRSLVGGVPAKVLREDVEWHA